MPIVQARQCSFTNKLFLLSDRKGYATHLRELRSKMKQQRTIRNAKNEWLKLRHECTQLSNGTEIVNWLVANQTKIYETFRFLEVYNNAYGKYGNDSVEYIKEEFKKIKNRPLIIDSLSLSTTHSPEISNSHVCPFNGVTNFSHSDDKPKYYEGYRGKISIRFGGCYIYHMSSILSGLGLKTGSGGGSGKGLSYEVFIFSVDFPNIANSMNGLREEHEKLETQKERTFNEDEMIRRIAKPVLIKRTYCRGEFVHKIEGTFKA